MVLELTKLNVDKFDRLIAEEMAKMKIGGLSYAILKDGEIAYKQGFGARNLDKNLPADENTIYNIASTTKSFVCTASMILVDEGKLRVTDAVKDYLPLEVETGNTPITIKHLMNHTSGIPNLESDTFSYNMTKEQLAIPANAKLVPMSSEADFFRIINSSGDFTHEIDQYFHYNNFAYAMLGMIITKVSGKDYREFIKERIFEPLGMTSTTFFPEEFKDNDNLAQGYHVNSKDRGGNTRKIGIFENRWEFMAAGGIYSCVKDLSTYMLMHLGKGTFKDVMVISEASSEEMQRNSLQPGTLAAKLVSNYTPQKSLGYGYGFFTNSDFYGNFRLDHGGNMFGGTADFLFIPTLKIGLVALANNYLGPRPIMGSIFALVAGTPEDRVHFLVERKHFKKLNGIYEGFNETDRLKISGEFSSLTVQSIDKHEFAILPTVFFPNEKHTLTPMEFYTRFPGGAKFIVFFEEIDGILWFNYERLRFKKIGKLYD